MRTKVTFVLLFLNVALFLFIFRFERAWRTDEAATEVRHRVLGAEAANLTAIAVTGSGPATDFRLERGNGGWRLSAPFDWPANPDAVDRLRTDLQLLDDETSFTVEDMTRSGQTLADYGLAQPAFTVTLVSGGLEATGARAVVSRLVVGSATRAGQRRYLLSPDGRRIHVVSRAAVDSLLPPPERLRSPAVLGVPVYEAVSLNLLPAAGARVRIRRDPGDAGRWMFETPIAARANRTEVELTINGLDDLRVRSFEPEGTPPAGPAALRVAIEGDHRAETLFLEGAVPGATAPGARVEYAQLEDLAKPSGRSVLFTVAIPDVLDRRLRDPAETLRDRRVLDFDPAAVTAVTLHAPGAADVVLQRLEPGAGGAAWQMLASADGGPGPRAVPADAGAVDALLRALSALSVREFKSDAPTDADRENWGLAQPARRIVLRMGEAAQTLDIGQSSPRDRDAYAQAIGSASVYTIDADILRQTPVSPLDWRDRSLLSLPDSAHLTAVSLTDLSTGSAVWSWKEKGGAVGIPAARLASVSEVASQWRALKAVRFVADTFDPARGVQGPWRYRLDGTFVLPGGSAGATESAHSLYLTERRGGTEQWAGSAEFGAQFQIGQGLIDALWTLTYGDRDPGAPAGP